MVERCELPAVGFSHFAIFVMYAETKLESDKSSSEPQYLEGSNPSRAENDEPRKKESFEKIPVLVAALSFIGFYMLLFLGFVNHYLFPSKRTRERCREDYPSIYNTFENIYFNYVFRRIRDGWERPVSGVPGTEIVLKDRVTEDNGWTFKFTGTETRCINLGSYNYLGFAESSGPCAEDSIEAIKNYGWAMCSSRRELGTTPLHTELEELMAQFLGVEACITFGMGFATNALNIPSIISKKCLVLSDERNHASLILGLKLSGATLRIYKHNDVEDLECKLWKGITEGQPVSGDQWDKVFIVCEGVFSMEGSIVRLPEIIALKKKYKAYLYLDEAHSIGAIGKRGRGVVDYYGCDPKDVDILMGTFTKSFGSAGGYIAGSKELINFLRRYSDAVHYASSMSPPVAQQIITAMKIIMGHDGTNEGVKRIRKLMRNTHYFRQRLHRMGLVIYGHEDSPVAPMLIYYNSKVSAAIREYLKYNIATVGVGFPATPLLEGRIRFCLSAGHTRQQLEKTLEVTELIADKFGFRYSSNPQKVIPVKYIETENEEDI